MSILKFKRTIIFSAFFISINFAQTDNEINQIKIDTSKQDTKSEIVEKKSLHLYELNNFYNNRFNKQLFYLPEYKITYPSLYPLSNYNYRIKKYQTAKGLLLFNESFYKLLAKEYEKRGRYDLGELGRYLGIADNIITIILWVLSFNDF